MSFTKLGFRLRKTPANQLFFSEGAGLIVDQIYLIEYHLIDFLDLAMIQNCLVGFGVNQIELCGKLPICARLEGAISNSVVNESLVIEESSLSSNELRLISPMLFLYISL